MRDVFGSYQATQIEGAIRTSEQLRGPCAALPERLFGVGFDLRDAHGPEGLTAVDASRLYRGALVTRSRELLEEGTTLVASRSDREAFEQRRSRRGAEPYAKRVRALRGFADQAGKGSVSLLLEIAAREPALQQEVFDALAALLRDYGNVCPATEGIGYGGWFASSSGTRSIQSIMTACETRPPLDVLTEVVRAASASAGSADPRVREEVAQLLSALADPRGRPALARLATDTFHSGGEICHGDDEARVCEPHYPVRHAAREGLERLEEIEGRRREARARQAQ